MMDNSLSNIDSKKIFNLIKKQKAKNFSQYEIDNNSLSKFYLEEIKKLKVKKNIISDNKECKSIIHIEKLKWDSNHFELNIGKLDNFYYNSIKNAKEAIKNIKPEINKFDVVFFRISTSEPIISFLQKEHFQIMDTSVTYSYDFKKPLKIIDNEIRIRKVNSNDYEKLKQLAKLGFSKYRIGTDHFHSESLFSSKKADSLYVKWFKNIFKKNKSTIFVAEINNRIAGFLGPYLINDNINGFRIGQIPLSAISKEFSGKGVYTNLINHSLMWFKDKVNVLEVKTQIDNIPVQKAWITCGFKINRSHYNMHYHPPSKNL